MLVFGGVSTLLIIPEMRCALQDWGVRKVALSAVAEMATRGHLKALQAVQVGRAGWLGGLVGLGG